MTQLTTLDYVVMGIYFVVVLGIGWALRRMMRTSTDFFLSGRSLPPWVTGLAFLSANLGAQEVIGMGASGAKYGIATSHFYWIGAIPAMVFVGIFMMPFYYGSKARSVPEYLKLRFDEKTRTFNALGFAAMTVFSSGVSMYAMGKLLNLLLGWDFDTSIIVSAVIVLAYVMLGGLTSAIYNEVLQFFMIVFGFAPLVWVGLKQVGGWDGLTGKLAAAATQRGLPEYAYTNVWQGMGSASTNSIGIEWFGMVMGLGFVLSFGYWCTDFLVVQRAMAADSMTAARRTPLIAAVPKMFFPFLVILPGMIALAMGDNIIPAKLTAAGVPLLDTNGNVVLDYDLATPMMLVKLFPTGMLGLGLTALIASFMSGMAGNVTAFNTVWTYDIYQAHIRKHASDEHYLWMGRVATVGGIALSVAAAYVAGAFNNIMEFLQLVFAFVNAPLFATFALGMFWKRSTGHGAFWGLFAGTVAPAIHHGISLANGAEVGVKGGFFGVVLNYPSEMAQTFWTAIAAFTTCFVVTIVVSLATPARKESELEGLVYSLTPKPTDDARVWYEKPSVFAVAVLVVMVGLNVAFF
ncbi:sodium:solute symporter family protein [Gemmatimonas phototrophica]|uniref:Na+/galactose cotransporter n=1 Tax=Gemmatimonas phototrophica TaxID=1379270 RepID=A0A143BHG0_9BACT|nr:sodium:solute symporter family protein [Gemmatimonas phototrophica]AMW04055.1 Na+/galactose cotransporter [Gemmatimonas phototrophica]